MTGFMLVITLFSNNIAVTNALQISGMAIFVNVNVKCEGSCLTCCKGWRLRLVAYLLPKVIIILWCVWFPG